VVVGAFRTTDSSVVATTTTTSNSSSAVGVLSTFNPANSSSCLWSFAASQATGVRDSNVQWRSPQCAYAVDATNWFLALNRTQPFAAGWTEPYLVISDSQQLSWALTFYQPLMNQSTQQLLAVLGAELLLDTWTSQLRDLKLSDSGFVFVMNAVDGSVLSSSLPASASTQRTSLMSELAASVHSVYPTAAAAATASALGLSLSSCSVSVASLAPVAAQWLVVTVQPNSDHANSNDSISIALLVVSFVAACFLMGTSYWSVASGQ
jgi:hypothetical protein